MADTEISIELYADLCACMAETGGDIVKENEIALANGVSAGEWSSAKEYYTAKMSDPSDMGSTALTFMPLFQAAQARLRGGEAPGSLEIYSTVHAEMAFKKDPTDPEKKIDFRIVIAQHGFTHSQWLEMESYWTPRVVSDTDPKFNMEQAKKFRELIQMESDTINGINR